jgi:hypothetical protein
MTAHPKAHRPPSTRQIEASASEWVIRLNGKLTAALWNQFEDWLESDPRNEAAYLKQEQSWNRVRHLVKTIRTGDASILERLEEKIPRGRPVRESKAAAPSAGPACVVSLSPLVVSDLPRASLAEPRAVAVISTPAQDHACEVVSAAPQLEGSTAASTPTSTKWLEERIARLLSCLGQLPSNPKVVKTLALSAPLRDNTVSSDLDGLYEVGFDYQLKVVEGNTRVAALKDFLLKRMRPPGSVRGIGGQSRMIFLCHHHASFTGLDDSAQLFRKQLTLALQGHSHESALEPPRVIHLIGHAAAGLEDHFVRDFPVQAKSLDSTNGPGVVFINACESTFAVPSNRSRSSQGDWYTWLSRYAELLDTEAELTWEKCSEFFNRGRDLSSKLALPPARGSLKRPPLRKEQVRNRVAKANQLWECYSFSEVPTERTVFDEEWIAAAESFQRYALR